MATDDPDNDNGEDEAVCEFCKRPIFGKIVMDANFTPACEECAGPAMRLVANNPDTGS